MSVTDVLYDLMPFESWLYILKAILLSFLILVIGLQVSPHRFPIEFNTRYNILISNDFLIITFATIELYSL